jgi:hypothetical protein
MKMPTIRLAIALCSLGAALPAAAEDVRAELTPDLIYSHCRLAGVGSQTEGTFMLPGGRVTGTVHCTEADVSAVNMPSPNRDHDDDDDDYRGGSHDDDDDTEDGDDD